MRVRAAGQADAQRGLASYSGMDEVAPLRSLSGVPIADDLSNHGRSIWRLGALAITGELRYQTITVLVCTLFVEPSLRVLLAQFATTATVSKSCWGRREAIAGSSVCVSSGMANLPKA